MEGTYETVVRASRADLSTPQTLPRLLTVNFRIRKFR